ncbi:class I SAM-dependent DNA methyltransferase [candidate division KSB1 bacterium]
MTKLYTELANIYYEMYQSLFDYGKEFEFYSNYLNKYKCRSILELGCGNGILASYFLKSNYEYTGLDISYEMLEIARKNNPDINFIQGDMRDLQINEKFDAVIIPGRSFCYMTTNDDVMNALKSVHNSLKEYGILVCDNYQAEKIFSDFDKQHESYVNYKNKKYRRVSKKSLNLKTGWTWNWDAVYYIEEKGKETKIINDESILRAFTNDELKLFLELNKFDVLEIIEDNSLFYTIAVKVNPVKT